MRISTCMAAGLLQGSVLAWCLFVPSAAAGGGQPGAMQRGSAPGATPPEGEALTDYDDFRLVPIRNADLVRLIDAAELIVAVRFKLDELPAAAGGASTWRAWVLPHSEGRRPSVFKGECGRAVTITADPKAFENPPGPSVSDRGFRPRDEFLLFLKPAGREGVYQCVKENPGGFRRYGGRASNDYRGLYVGRVGRRIVVEGMNTRYGRITGPTTLTDALRGLALGVRLRAKATGGASVELRLENPSKRPADVPKKLGLWAPLLWAEIEGPGADRVLLSRQDYLLLREGNPWKPPGTLRPGGAVALRVELPTGPVPEGGVLTWAQCNHAEPLAGSLGEGEHTVRLLCHVAEDALVISNPVTVQGHAGAAGPKQLAALRERSPFVPRPSPPAAKPAQPLRKEDLHGEIYFESDHERSWDLFVMNADGSNVRNLTNTPRWDEFEPMPSPDGKRVAYATGGLGRRWSVWDRWNPDRVDVWVMDRDGKNARRLASNAIRPNWWPDGRAVVYSAQARGSKEVVCVQDLRTGKVTEPLKKVATWLYADGALTSFCPATRRLAFEGKLWTAACPLLMVVDLDENYEFKRFRPLTRGYRGCTPQWFSRDQLHFAHHDPKYDGAVLRWSFQPDGARVRRFRTPTQSQWDGYDLICESPDGTMITYSKRNDIHVMRLSDGAEVRLTYRHGRNKAPRWHRGGGM